MARHERQINIRMPQKLVDELKRNADENKRSVTAQLNFIVEEWLKKSGNNT
ncbi:Arc family DNA-binding protein [Acinetobacter venetianus]|uniref:Arc family DNA-binding protein n=1 Tax=Acinetobacter venetianus TaxID=52133 RepID=UPI0007783206|nr:Arc family DNA-binding protein [Acinetobacter venetianus]